MPSVDEKILASNSSSADRAGDFREAKQGGMDEKDNSSLIEKDDDLSKASAFNQSTQSSKNEKNKSAKKPEPGLISKGKVALAGALRWCWMPGLELTFGLTLIWINIHWVFNQVFPSLFCDFGEEWFLRSGVEASPAQKRVIKEAGKKFNLVETMGCGCLNLVILFMIITFLGLTSMVLQIFGDPIGFVTEVGKAVLGWVWDGAKSIFEALK